MFERYHAVHTLTGGKTFPLLRPLCETFWNVTRASSYMLEILVPGFVQQRFRRRIEPLYNTPSQHNSVSAVATSFYTTTGKVSYEPAQQRFRRRVGS